MAKLEPATILVKNHTTSILTIPLPYGRNADGSAFGRGEIVLLPGANPAVDAKKWAEAKSAPMIVALLKLRKREGLEVDEKTDASESLADLDENDAIDLVDETVDPKILAKWKKSEKRAEIVAAIEAQIEKLDPRKKDDGESGEGGEGGEE